MQKKDMVIDFKIGIHSRPAAMLVQKGCEVTITDGDPYVLVIRDFLQTSDLKPALDTGKLRIEVADATKLHYPDNSFDRVASIGALEHIPDDGDKTAVKEIARVLCPGGIAFITLEAKEKYEELWMHYHHFLGVQYKDEYDEKSSKDKSTEQTETEKEGADNILFTRFYDDNALRERIIETSGMELLEYGYFADSYPLRTEFQEKQNPVFLGFLRHFQPILSVLFYRRYNSSDDLQHRFAAIPYVILKK